MIRDLELIENPELIQELIQYKKIVIWGSGNCGKGLFAKLWEKTDRIEFIDSDESKRYILW